MCIWQSQALAGALSLGASVPLEFGTECWAWLSLIGSPPVAARPAIAVVCRNVRRSIWRMGFLPVRQAVNATNRVRWGQGAKPRVPGLHSAPVHDMLTP